MTPISTIGQAIPRAATDRSMQIIFLLVVLVPFVLVYRARSVPDGDWIVVANKQPTYIPVTTEQNVAVIESDEWRVTFQHVENDGKLYGRPFTEDICPDYASPREDFIPGIILDLIVHTEEPGSNYGIQGNCWSLNPDKHCGYYKRRDSQHRALYADGFTVPYLKEN